MKTNTRIKKLNAFLLLTSMTMLIIGRPGPVDGVEQKSFEIQSPDKSIKVNISVGEETFFSVMLDGEPLLKPSPISISVNNKRIPGKDAVIADVGKDAVRQSLKPVVAEAFSVIDDHYDECILRFHNDYALTFRAYNNGVAYRFCTQLEGKLDVTSEQATFNFTDGNVYYPEEEQFFSHNERTYHHLPFDSLAPGRLASLPVLIETRAAKILLAESSLRDYPGMWLKSGEGNQLYGVFPHFALESKMQPGSDRNMPVTKYADFIARTTGPRAFPWRILAIAREDGDLITNQLVFQLGEPLQITDPSWIKPGKVAWDWWNANNLYGVDFKAGINTETYKYYIDFASEFGIEYIILDEGWYKLGNLLDVVPDVDVKTIVDYGKQKNVGVILWVIWKTLDDQLETALDQFEKWGVKGIKVDFMQRDDQEMVNYYWKIAEEAAKRKLLVDYHGSYKPAGLRRAYPNVITREGVKGLENSKWSRDITPTHNLTIPFIRMVTGPMDYTPGAMVNAQPKNFHSIYTRPMSMGTRAHQIAMYVIYNSPLQMMSDSPSNYLIALESTQFIARIPTIWHDTRVLNASVGKYLVVARKNGDQWFIAAMTNEGEREFTLNLSFLGQDNYTVDIIEDGINADRFAEDYKMGRRYLSGTDTFNIKLAPGGGWVAIATPNQ
jgi:alpha-glucosidase